MVGQIIAAVLIIYFLYMLYFDRMQEEHFGSIRQQAWSFLHFPLHLVLVLALQGVSLLIIWRQAVESLNVLKDYWTPAVNWVVDGGEVDPKSLFGSFLGHVSENYTQGMALADYLNATCYWQVYNFLPKGVDASKEIKLMKDAYYDIYEGFDNLVADTDNATAGEQFVNGFMSMTSATYTTLFNSFSVTVPKTKAKKESGVKQVPDLEVTERQYYIIFDLVLTYAFIAVSTSDSCRICTVD